MSTTDAVSYAIGPILPSIPAYYAHEHSIMTWVCSDN